MKSVFILLLLISVCQFAYPQAEVKKPKLVIGLVIDQMRWDYLYRFNDVYGKGGFKRLMQEGYSCNNVMLPYLPTYTAPGHACIYTGSVPAFHGIVGNDWYDKQRNKLVYCTDDSTVYGIGSSSSTSKMSPRNMWATTITDELRLSTNFKSKTIGIALKDRAAILPAGQSANAAYWYDERAGKWITSSYYIKELPVWVSQFDQKNSPDKFMTKDWTTLLPITKYDASTAASNEYEHTIPGETTTNFPHKITSDKKYDAFRYTPFADTYTFAFAKATIEGEKLGERNVTDFLAISLSAPDFVGHTFGPNSIETEDTYARLDADISDFLIYLDNKLGKGNYILFLSADHGVSHIPGFLKEHNMPAGSYSPDSLMKHLNKVVSDKFQISNPIIFIDNSQLYLNQNATGEVKRYIIEQLMEQPYIANAFETGKISVTDIAEPLKKMLINSYTPLRSGDIQYILKPAYFEGTEKGTTHGSWNLYDSHIPLLWFGTGIKHGASSHEYYMTDITATLAALLHIQMPNTCIGKVIEEIK